MSQLEHPPSLEPSASETATHPDEPGPFIASFGFSILCSSLAGMLLWLCHFPVSAGWLAWFAIAPLLYLVRSPAPSRRVYGAAWLAGILFFLPALQWMRVADPRMYFTWIGLALYCSLLVPAKVFLIRRLDRGTALPLMLTAPAVWVALDYFQAHFGTGFPWYFLGYSQHDYLTLIQIADLGGVYAVTFLLVLGNVWVFNVLNRTRLFRDYLLPAAPSAAPNQWTMLVESGILLVLIWSTLEYGYWRLDQHSSISGPRLALIQGNLDQRIRNQASEEAGAQAAVAMLNHYARLTDLALRQMPAPDLIVWPETSFPDEWTESSAGRLTKASQEIIDWVTRRWHTNILLGMNCRVEEPNVPTRRYNSAILLSRTGTVLDRYDKIHRVPFGEYVPWRDWLPFMNLFAPYDFDYSIQAGRRFTRFTLDGTRFGVLICFEDTDPALAPCYVDHSRAEPSADFLINISNDGWFQGTSEHEEHLAICRFRAIETRRAVARAVNMGISAIIDGSGRVLRLEETDAPDPDTRVWQVATAPDKPSGLRRSQWSHLKRIAGVLIGSIPIDDRTSLFAHYGPCLPYAAWIVVIGGIAWPFTRPRRWRR
jgi:apolipoprotein N-acyltransferase